MGSCFGHMDGQSGQDDQGWFIKIVCCNKNAISHALPCNSLLHVRKSHLLWYTEELCSFQCVCGMNLSINKKLIPLLYQPLAPPSLFSPLISSFIDKESNANCSIM